MRLFTRTILILLLLAKGSSLFSQKFTPPIAVLKFTDKYGNDFRLNNPTELPEGMSEKYLSQNLTGIHLNYKEGDTLKFNYTITSIKKIKKEKYEMRIQVFPQSTQIKTNLLYPGGASHYQLVTKKSGKKREIVSVSYLFGEI